MKYKSLYSELKHLMSDVSDKTPPPFLQPNNNAQARPVISDFRSLAVTCSSPVCGLNLQLTAVKY